MLIRRNPSTNTAVSLALAIVWMAHIGCGDGREIGKRCDKSSDCEASLQCLDGYCAPACQRNLECGDGAVCFGGDCVPVESELGDACERERDCGAGQTCAIEDVDSDGDDRLSAQCAAQLPGGVLGTRCTADDDCASGSCNIGLCTEVCATRFDCPSTFSCTLIPRLAPADGMPPELLDSAFFDGCFPSNGTVDIDFNLNESHELLPLLVPGNARSISISAQSASPTLSVGPSFLAAPTGSVWYTTPTNQEEFLANPVRFEPLVGRSTLLAPNRPDLELVAGVFTVRVGTFLPNGQEASEVPQVTLFYKLGESATLDINVHFLDLESHGCQVQIGGAPLSAETAPAHVGLREFTDRISTIFEPAGIEVGEIRFFDIAGQPGLDILDQSRLPELLSIAAANHATNNGVNIFVVRSIAPVGLQVIGLPGVGSPGSTGRDSSFAVALSLDTLCYRDWRTTARLVAHSIARQMGLFRNREPGGAFEDPIDDSTGSIGNLLFFSEFGGTGISTGQAMILRHHPGLR